MVQNLSKNWGRAVREYKCVRADINEYITEKLHDVMYHIEKILELIFLLCANIWGKIWLYAVMWCIESVLNED